MSALKRLKSSSKGSMDYSDFINAVDLECMKISGLSLRDLKVGSEFYSWVRTSGLKRSMIHDCAIFALESAGMSTADVEF